MQRSDFEYELPEELIAQQPLPERTASRLLCVDGGTGHFEDRMFQELPALLREGDLLVLNDTRVIPARLYGYKPTGGRVEVLVERVLDAQHVLAHVRASKSPREGTRLTLTGSDAVLLVSGREGSLFALTLEKAPDIHAVLTQVGHMPLPPYIERADSAADRERYQTVFAQRPGAVAAPTAGLHFDQVMLDKLQGQGVEVGRLTLHVGAGTFQPVREEDLDAHHMHSEWFEVSADLCEQIAAVRARGGRVVAVGTTVVRALEAAVAEDGELRPRVGETRLFIRPGYRFRVIDALLTNFHLPGSTLLMLVCAFAGHAPVMAAYRHAVAARYRFFSYGDAMFLTRAACRV